MKTGILCLLISTQLLSISSGQVDIEVRFASSDSMVTMAGTITRPDYGEPSKLALLLPVAGPTDRDLTLGRHKYYKELADVLARQGIASLRFDDRGTGNSGGDLFQTSLEDRVNDACQAFATLCSGFPNVGSAGLIGMSEGTGISVRASQICGPASFLVLLSAPVRPGTVEMEQQMSRLLEASAFPEETKQKITIAGREFLALASQPDPGAQRDSIYSLLSGPYGQVVLPPYGFVPRTPEAKTDFVLSPWYQSQLNYDVQEAFAQLDIPVLALYGDLDQAIDPKANAQLLQAISPLVKVETYPGINHLMQDAKTGSPLEYMLLPTSFSPTISNRILEWLQTIE